MSKDNKTEYYLPPIRTESSDLDGSFNPKVTLPSFSTLANFNDEQNHSYINQSDNRSLNYMQARGHTHPGYNQLYVESTPYRPQTQSSPNSVYIANNSDLNLDPKILERRRRNASASARSRTRRRLRETDMQHRNQFLEAQLTELHKINAITEMRAKELEQANKALLKELESYRVKKEGDTYGGNPEYLYHNYNQCSSDGRKPTGSEASKEVEGRYNTYNFPRDNFNQLDDTIRKGTFELNEKHSFNIKDVLN